MHADLASRGGAEGSLDLFILFWIDDSIPSLIENASLDCVGGENYNNSMRELPSPLSPTSSWSHKPLWVPAKHAYEEGIIWSYTAPWCSFATNQSKANLTVQTDCTAYTGHTRKILTLTGICILGLFGSGRVLTHKPSLSLCVNITINRFDYLMEKLHIGGSKSDMFMLPSSSYMQL